MGKVRVNDFISTLDIENDSIDTQSGPMVSSVDPMVDIEDTLIVDSVEPIGDMVEPIDILKSFSPLERRMIELTTNGDSLDIVSLKVALPVSVVKTFISRKDVRDHIKSLSESLNEMGLLRIKAIYSKMLDARMDEVDGDMSQLSKKDTLDVIKAYQELIIAERKSMKPETQQNVFVNILNQIME